MTLVATSALLNVVVFKHGREVPTSAIIAQINGSVKELFLAFYLLSEYLKGHVLGFQAVELLYC